MRIARHAPQPLLLLSQRWHEQRVILGSTKLGSPNTTPRKRPSKPALDLPVLEDADAIQVSLMQVMRLLLSGQIEHKTASLLLYGLQTASSNLRQVTFDPAVKEKIVIDPRSVDETPLGDYPWSNDDWLDDDWLDADWLDADPDNEERLNADVEEQLNQSPNKAAPNKEIHMSPSAVVKAALQAAVGMR